MAVRVAVVGDTRTWRRGTSALLQDAGYSTSDVAELPAWRPGRDGRAVVVAIDGEPAIEALREFCHEHPHIPVVTVLPELSLDSYAAVVRTGATGAVCEEESPETLALTLQAALAGYGAVPSAILQAMAARIPKTPEPGAWVSPEEAGWLQRLAAGATVADLAEDVGYSEREMFRNLRDTYAKLGVRNRTEAIIWATRHSLVEIGDAADGGRRGE